MAVFWKMGLVVTLALCSQVFARIPNDKLLGGWRDVDANNDNVQRALQFAKEEYNRQHKDGPIIEINRVLRSRMQVVAGSKYIFVVEAHVCNGPVNESTEECPNDNTTKKTCEFHVFSVPWKKINELTSGYCL